MTRNALILLSLLISFSIGYADTKSDTHYMQMAINLAKKQSSAPFGAVIVSNKTGQVLCTGLNAVEAQHNPTLHGEVMAINNCAKKYPDMDWKHATLFTTAEPCPMCQSAIVWAGIPRMVFGTSIETLIRLNWWAITIKAKSLNEHARFYHGTVTGGVLADKTDLLFTK